MEKNGRFLPSEYLSSWFSDMPIQLVKWPSWTTLFTFHCHGCNCFLVLSTIECCHLEGCADSCCSLSSAGSSLVLHLALHADTLRLTGLEASRTETRRSEECVDSELSHRTFLVDAYFALKINSANHKTGIRLHLLLLFTSRMIIVALSATRCTEWIEHFLLSKSHVCLISLLSCTPNNIIQYQWGICTSSAGVPFMHSYTFSIILTKIIAGSHRIPLQNKKSS